MALEVTDIQNQIADKFSNSVSEFRMEHDILTFHASIDTIHSVIAFMKENETLRFNFLTDLCGVHYPDNQIESRFAVVYLLHNWIDNVRVRVKVFFDADTQKVPTATDLFASANWMERETFDFYGVIFDGHPNLKRILNADEMEVFPMRKEYPMEDTGRTDKDDRFFGRTTNNYQPTEKKD